MTVTERWSHGGGAVVLCSMKNGAPQGAVLIEHQPFG